MKLNRTALLPFFLLAEAVIAADDAETAKNAPFPWPNPFEFQSLTEYKPSCENSITLPANEYQLHDLYESPPLGLWPWADALKGFFAGQEYPKSWDGIDPHGYDRVVLKMEYADVPRIVRQWMEEKGEKLFAVYQKPDGEWKKVRSQSTSTKAKSEDELEDEDDASSKVTIFAPGALYEILPLFVAEESSCRGTFADLAKYTAEIKDGAVIAGIVKHTIPDRAKKERDIEIEIKAQEIKLKNTGKDEL